MHWWKTLSPSCGPGAPPSPGVRARFPELQAVHQNLPHIEHAHLRRHRAHRGGDRLSPALERALEAGQGALVLCGIIQDQTIIDIGCGTGSTACYLAQIDRARVTAVDLSTRCVAEARRWVVAQDLAASVAVVQVDAHALPCVPGAFDVAVLESAATFCDLERLVAEVWRVLKPGGALGSNELTLRVPPSAELDALLTGTLASMRDRRPSGGAPGRAPGLTWLHRKCTGSRCASDFPIICTERAGSGIGQRAQGVD